ncbi:hypothetical protein SSX86_026295 [Deinandra increscens subsp. villosa]|uniref:Uncharacterized protein n=1 Tax=Deinandra increscens subsp. villosa TaxID=3103831 RepID=A0AAP0GM43_9ASTR
MTLQTAFAPSSPVIVHRSPWHSPVPYLFGGLAAMLSLIAFALLILACSYSKHAGDRDDAGADGERDLEAGDSKPENSGKELPPVFEEKYLVIMAGEANPTYLATPVSSRASSFGSCSCRSNSSEKSSTEMTEESETEKQGSGDQLQVRSTGDQENTDQQP